MSDWTLQPCSTLIVGMTGSGKTTFAIRYLLNVPAVCRFVFDDLGQIAARLNMRHAGTAAELEAALATRWVIFNPHLMFPGDVAAAFAFFCAWAFNCARRGPGKKVFLADEVWRWCSPNSIPKELAALAQMGRAENLELVTATQLPHKIHASITGQSTEMVCFRVNEPLALDKVQELGGDRDAVQGLPLGSFVSWNRLSQASLAGQVF
jgi:hypothetical protein